MMAFWFDEFHDYVFIDMQLLYHSSEVLGGQEGGLVCIEGRLDLY